MTRTPGRHSASTPPAPPAGVRGANAFRPDIEGLRAIAVGTVLIYHAGFAFLPGGFVGVDIFFVISGFLITGLMLREVGRSGRLDLAAFWARRARRLLPASLLVLVFSSLATVLWLPEAMRKVFGGDIMAAAAYVVNWRLGYREVDYLAEDVSPSPVQHYWSLAVEEQFYLIWPLLIAAVLLVFRSRWRRAATVAVLSVTVASFVFALWYSQANAGLAFFVSTTRVWELGVGALLAAVLPRLVRMLPAVSLALVGWAGLAAIAVAALTYDGAVTWPGVATLLPVLGAAALILSGSGDTPRWAPARLLGLRPMVWVGGLSYSLYLWHWPFIVTAQALWPDLRVRHLLLVVAAAAAPAWLSNRFVEDPIRHGRRFRSTPASLRLGLVTTLASVVAGALVVGSFALVRSPELQAGDTAPGAAALLDPDTRATDWTAIDHVPGMTPVPLEAEKDLPPFYHDHCLVTMHEDGWDECHLGDRSGDRTVVLVGDSKMAQWVTPFDRIARQQGWKMEVYIKEWCEFGKIVRLLDGQRNTACEKWSARALDKILRTRPDLVITATRADRALPLDGGTESDYAQHWMVDGLADYWQRITDAGVPLVAVLDNPSPTLTVNTCVQANLTKLSSCVFDREPGLQLSGQPAQRKAAAEVPAVKTLDLTDLFCPDGKRCPAVIGQVLVYRSGTHVGNTYAVSATPQISDRMHSITGGRFGKPLTTP